MGPGEGTTYSFNVMIGDLGIWQYPVMTNHQLALSVEIGTGKNEALRSLLG